LPKEKIDHDPDLRAAVEDVAHYMEAKSITRQIKNPFEIDKEKILEEAKVVLERLEVSEQLAISIIHDATYLIHELYQAQFGKEATGRIAAETTLMEETMAFAVGFFVTGALTERLRIERERAVRTSEGDDPRSAEGSGGSEPAE
jgi:hypothetical protein